MRDIFRLFSMAIALDFQSFHECCAFSQAQEKLLLVSILCTVVQGYQKHPASNSQKKRAVLYCGPSNKSVDVVAGTFAGNLFGKSSGLFRYSIHEELYI